MTPESLATNRPIMFSVAAARVSSHLFICLSPRRIVPVSISPFSDLLESFPRPLGWKMRRYWTSVTKSQSVVRSVGREAIQDVRGDVIDRRTATCFLRSLLFPPFCVYYHIHCHSYSHRHSMRQCFP